VPCTKACRCAQADKADANSNNKVKRLSQAVGRIVESGRKISSSINALDG
jgi:hypothetical protein